MIPQTFEYSAPKTLDEALDLLQGGAKPLAGGMSLIPMMKLRLATPEQLVDIGRLKELNYIRRGRDTAAGRRDDALRGRELGAGAIQMPSAGRDRGRDRRRAGSQHGDHRRQRGAR